MVPLNILITDSSLVEHPDIVEHIGKLQKAGHNIVVNDELKQYDFIAGPNCWLLRPEVAGLFQVAVKQSRIIANADQARAEQQAAKKHVKGKPRAASKSTKGAVKAQAASAERTGPRPADPAPEPTTDSGGV